MSQPTKLFEPFKLGPITLPNRLVMAPLTRNRAVPPGMVPSPLAVEYYAQRASAGLLVTDFAVRGCARVTHSEVPSTPDTEKSFEELRQRLAKTIDYVKSFKPAQFEGADTRDVTVPIGPDKTMTMKGQQFISNFSLPQFYFHAAIAHGLLRHNGVEVGKRDFMGAS